MGCQRIPAIQSGNKDPASITKPEALGGDTHHRAFDKDIFLIGGDSNESLDPDADIEMTLDDAMKRLMTPDNY